MIENHGPLCSYICELFELQSGKIKGNVLVGGQIMQYAFVGKGCTLWQSERVADFTDILARSFIIGRGNALGTNSGAINDHISQLFFGWKSVRKFAEFV